MTKEQTNEKYKIEKDVNQNKSYNKKSKKNIHAGHRGRLLELIEKCGLENLSEIQALEFFLTYVFPRGDTNPLAHRLLDEFQTFTNVLEADPEELVQVEGINKRSASLIASFKELFFYFYSCRIGNKFQVTNLRELLDIVEDNLRFRTTEYALLIGLSASDYITRKRLFSNKNAGNVGIDTQQITRFISSNQPASLVVAHCHPYGKAFESQKDVEAFKQINNICSSCGVKFVDSYIVGEDGVFSQRSGAFVRDVKDISEVAEEFQNYLRS